MGRLYVHITEQCRTDACRHAALEWLKDLAEKTEAEQSTAAFERFPRPVLKKSHGKQGRLIVLEYKVEDDLLCCFTRYLIRGDSEYNVFLADPEGYAERHRLNQEQLAEIVAERRTQSVVRKPELSPDEREFLEFFAERSASNVGTFMESYDWFNLIQDERAREQLGRYYELVVDIFDDNFPQGADVVRHSSNPNIGILFRKFPEHGVAYLIAPLFSTDPENEKILRRRYEDFLQCDSIEYEKLVRESRRAYPATIVFDEPTWFQVQKSVEANLALSPEEEGILGSLLFPQNSERRYPLFINGRPGSGKSTILQYLFAEHLGKYLEMAERGTDLAPPLYLTYSDALLEQARSAVRNILHCSAKRLESRGAQAARLPNHLLDQSFRQFRGFLLSELPPDARSRFSHDRYVDFGRFQQIWEPWRSKHPDSEIRDIGPELAWHVIRTYIKGMSHSDDMSGVDPDMYARELPRSMKSVPDDKFELIYEKVWDHWYRRLAEEQGLWDDQDLVREVLRRSSGQLSRFSAVFCDEAQDFTSLELELIQKLSLYSVRELPSYLARNVPFAFAGDPFQTLNPTGFNWAAVQASFHNNIVQRIDGLGAAQLKFNYHELHSNYRSSEPIVKLANLVQLVRGVNLGMKDLVPQEPWKHLPAASPVWFRATDAQARAAIRDQEELVIIIPCQENQEREYVKNDEFLNSIALRDDDDKLHRNVLSPVRAKGLEYNRVLLYKFGEEALKRGRHWVERISRPRRDEMPVEERLEFEYFINQLYVAISRARLRLFIMDSDEAIEKFWTGVFTDGRARAELITLYENEDSERWNNLISGIVPGDASSFADEGERDNPLTLAEELRRNGELARDPHLLRLASHNYELAGRPELAKQCEAQAYEFAENFGRAAELYKSLGDKAGAARCYWAAKDMEACRDLAGAFPEFVHDSRYQAARVLLQPELAPAQLGEMLDGLRRAGLSTSHFGSAEGAAWRWYFKELLAKMTKQLTKCIKQEKNRAEQWRATVVELVDALKDMEMSPVEYLELGELLCLVEEFGRARQLWDQARREKAINERGAPRWVTEVLAHTEPYPLNVQYFSRLKDHRNVVEAWHAAGNELLKETPVDLILASAIEIGDIDAMRRLLLGCTELERVQRAVESCKKQDVDKLRGVVPVAIARALDVKRNWRELIRFARKGKTSDSQLNVVLQRAGMTWPRYVRVAAAVRVLARSETLGNVDSRTQQTISEFLREYLLLGHDASPERREEFASVHRLISLAEAGTAFEKAFRLVNALEYYEQWFKGDSAARNVLEVEDHQIALAKQRWILCKYRQGDVTRVDAHTEEARRAEQEWGMSVHYDPKRITYLPLGPVEELALNKSHSDDADETVPVPSVRDSSAEEHGGADDERLTVFETRTPGGALATVRGPGFKLDMTLQVDSMRLLGSVQAKRGRVVWTREDTEEQVFCGREGVVSHDVEVRQFGNDSWAWLITPWNLVCQIRNSDCEVLVRLCTPSGDAIFGVTIPSTRGG